MKQMVNVLKNVVIIIEVNLSNPNKTKTITIHSCSPMVLNINNSFSNSEETLNTF